MENFEWTFKGGKSSPHVTLDEQGTSILFNPVFSIGTSVCVGNRVLEKNFHHFWEFELTSPIYGTAFMVGVGSDELDITECSHSFLPFLGNSEKSWGYCHDGKLYYRNKESVYHDSSLKWNESSILGVHLDLWRGQMSFYLDKRPLGVAFNNIPRDIRLYPMVSCTAAKTGINLVTSRSFPESLSFNCVKEIGDMIRISKDSIHLKDFLLPPGLNRFIENNLSYLVNVKTKDHRDLFLATGGPSYGKIESDDTDTELVVRTMSAIAAKNEKLVAGNRRSLDLYSSSSSSESDDDYQRFFKETKTKPLPVKKRRKKISSNKRLSEKERVENVLTDSDDSDFF